MSTFWFVTAALFIIAVAFLAIDQAGRVSQLHNQLEALPDDELAVDGVVDLVWPEDEEAALAETADGRLSATS